MTGKLSAASTSATSAGDDDSDVISQPEPTSCIHDPTLDTTVAIHTERNNAERSGCHAVARFLGGEAAPFGDGSVGESVLIASGEAK